jgi:hypothetical protein
MFVINRNFLINNKLSFLNGIYHEDELFVILVIAIINKISIYHKPLYIQKNRIDSLSKDQTIKGPYDKIIIIDTLIKYIEDNGSHLNTEAVFLIKSRLSQLWTGIFLELISFNLSVIENNTIFNLLIHRKHILKYSNKIKHIMLYYLTSILGIEKCYTLLKLIKH